MTIEQFEKTLSEKTPELINPQDNFDMYTSDAKDGEDNSFVKREAIKQEVTTFLIL